MIDVIIPVLGRPERIMPLVKNIQEVSVEWSWITLMASDDDAEGREVCLEASTYEGVRMFTMLGPHPGDYSRKINMAFDIGWDPFVLLGATDILFHPGWDTAALAVAEETGAGVIGTNDLGNRTVMAGRHSTHPLVRRSYIAERGGTFEQTPGVVLCDQYGHQWVDTELIVVAKKRHQWAFAKDSHVEHQHPFWHKGEMDAVYEKGLSTSKADQALYRQRERQLLKGIV